MSVPFHFEQVQTAGGVRAPGLFYSETLPKNPSLRARNRQQVIRVHDALCNRHDASVLDTDFAPGFIDHSPFMSGGLQGVREMLELLPDLHHEVVRVLADGDLVAIHGRYTGLGSTPLVGFDIYRLSGGRIVEQGSHDELIAKGGLYAQLWSRQTGGYLGDEASTEAE